MKGAPFLISLIVLLALLSPCIYARSAPESTEEGSFLILSPIAEGLGLIVIIFLNIVGLFIGIATIFAGLSFLIIPIPITVPLGIIAALIGIIAALIGIVLAFVAFALYTLIMLGSISPRVANLLNRIITPMIDFYHRIEKWAIS